MLSALGLQPGDEVILPPLTCNVVPLTLFSLNLKPVYADVSPDTLNLNPASVSEAIGPATRAILFQHTYGNSGGLGEVVQLATARRLPVIEDRAQCLPRATPAIAGRGAIFSNNLLKPLPAGSGGVAVTNDAALGGELLRMAAPLPAPGSAAMARLRVEAWLHRRVLRPELYWFALGLLSRLSGRYGERPVTTQIQTEVTAAAHAPSDYQMKQGAGWLARADEWARLRAECCADYLEGLGGCPGVQIPAVDFSQPLYYFPVRTKRKRELLREARRRHIELIAWPNATPIYPLETAAQLVAYGFHPASCPVANELAGELIGLPTHDRITPRHRRQIVTLLTTFHSR